MHYHKWGTYNRLAIDLRIILRQILRCFVNRAHGLGLHFEPLRVFVVND